MDEIQQKCRHFILLTIFLKIYISAHTVWMNDLRSYSFESLSCKNFIIESYHTNLNIALTFQVNRQVNKKKMNHHFWNSMVKN